MSNLLASLASSAGALEAYGQVLETAQNNVSNASTPGYAKQLIDLYALPFDPQSGVTGGLRAGKLVSTRDEFSEQAVRRQTSLLGYQQQLVDSLTAIQSNFDISGNKDDSGLSANMHATLEQLSTLVDVTATFQPDGTVNLMLNGETPLLLGEKQYAISSSLYQPQDPPPTNANGPANVRILGSNGSDITSKTTGAQLGALLHLRNQILPSYIGDAYQAGDLNVMAKQFADRVNSLLTSGNISDGPPPVPGVPLFTYDTANATNTAATLAVDPSVTPDQLAAISLGPLEVSNGVPLALSAMASPVQDADKVNGLSYSEFYGQLAGRVGAALNDATNNQDVQQSLLTQAQNLRQQYQGVSLDEEATILMQFQRAYQATSKFLTVLDQLTETAIDMLPTS